MEEVFPVDMLDYLVCPETHQRLALAEPELLAKLQARQQAGQLQNRIGQPIQEPLQQALVREDRQFAYPVSDGFPIMLIDEAIPLNQQYMV
jgi:uncharacterized protein YbaR (Trm112 family)